VAPLTLFFGLEMASEAQQVLLAAKYDPTSDEPNGRFFCFFFFLFFFAKKKEKKREILSKGSNTDRFD
jgi:hypothetical protein